MELGSFVDTGPASAKTLSDYAGSQYGMGYYGKNKIGDFFIDTFGRGKAIKNSYQTYLDQLENYNEWKATQSARAWDEYFDGTKYQRAVKDLQAAGLNPWLAVQSGVSGSGTTSAHKSSYNYKNSAKEAEAKASDAGRNVALFFLATAKIISALI